MYPQLPNQQQPMYPQPKPGHKAEYPHPTLLDPEPPIGHDMDFTDRAFRAMYYGMWLGIPGLVMAVKYLIQAHRIRRETGRTPNGYGCLWTLLISGLLPLLAGLLVMIFSAAHVLWSYP